MRVWAVINVTQDRVQSTWYCTSSPPARPDRLWGPPNRVSNGYRGCSGRGVTPATNIHLLPKEAPCIELCLHKEAKVRISEP
jgi:hypothetical protein